MPSHSILGNPTRFTARLEIGPNSDWRQRLPGWQRVAALALTFPLMPRRGYLGKGTSRP